jgi:hypothetical protein
MALKFLFVEEEMALLLINNQCIYLEENFTITGIEQISDERKLYFIHRSFVAFYVF